MAVQRRNFNGRNSSDSSAESESSISVRNAVFEEILFSRRIFLFCDSFLSHYIAFNSPRATCFEVPCIFNDASNLTFPPRGAFYTDTYVAE